MNHNDERDFDEEWANERYFDEEWEVDNDPYEGEIPNGSVVTVDGYRGVAFRVDGYRAGMIETHMVGDDRTFTVDPSEVTVLDDDEAETLCECGQLACGWGGA